ncbi:uncharacterized protein [Penaeus vannamei]|uniref:uncharacterized protein n=1 Tax=Penaeus vannamei TaxID=6689 RepID=UPI00387F44FD
MEINPKFNNSFEAKQGARGCWGEGAYRTLKDTRGKTFRHEKNKKKERGLLPRRHIGHGCQLHQVRLGLIEPLSHVKHLSPPPHLPSGKSDLYPWAARSYG